MPADAFFLVWECDRWCIIIIIGPIMRALGTISKKLENYFKQLQLPEITPSDLENNGAFRNIIHAMLISSWYLGQAETYINALYQLISMPTQCLSVIFSTFCLCNPGCSFADKLARAWWWGVCENRQNGEGMGKNGEDWGREGVCQGWDGMVIGGRCSANISFFALIQLSKSTKSCASQRVGTGLIRAAREADAYFKEASMTSPPPPRAWCNLSLLAQLHQDLSSLGYGYK